MTCPCKYLFLDETNIKASRAYLAILLDKIDLDNFLEEAPEAKILSALIAFMPEDQNSGTHV